MDQEQFLSMAGIITVSGGVIAVMTKYVFIPVAQIVVRLSRFLSDWFGEDARDGVPGREGMMSRIARVEKAVERAEFHLGNGNPVPLREEVEQHSQALKEHSEALQRIETYGAPNDKE